MKRWGGLWDRVWSFENLLLATRRAQMGKRYRPDVLKFNHRREGEVLRLQRLLQTGGWRPGPHRHFLVYEPKRRWISAAPYADRVVHHAVCNVIGPFLDRRLIHDCWANRTGKGSHRAALRYQKQAARHRYALKMDIRRYFPSIDHAVLRGQLESRFREPRLLRLMNRIIDHGTVPQPHDAFFPGDNLLTPLTRPKGLPIGNLTSQLWANLYLDDFDHWIKEDLRARGYLRFVDDFVVLHDCKERLGEWRERIEQALVPLRLLIHRDKSVIRSTREGLPFLGYVLWPNKIRVRGESVRRFRKRLRHETRKVGHEPSSTAKSLAAWGGHVRLAGQWRQLYGLT